MKEKVVNDVKDKEETSAYAGVYAEIAEIIGEDKIEEFYERFKGQQVVFSMKLYSREYVVRKAMEMKDTMRIADIAKQFGYSERYIRKLLAAEESGE